ncbi:hypothetical protein EDD16DRAFT_598992 [Pisolithus croceorrhizus]|nr:hypothetical protein EDD16DRAFT_598992 [Pisolithus croceorrhizus]KAI6113972.1 hypothetical protein EV401DRAFT_139927 [Pisolithus croceorrhizus]KAI6145682.1 hypothetical protein EDD17DRAFT_131395 [Pisolithus thermaeus]
MVQGDFSKVRLLNFSVPGGHSLLVFQLTPFSWEKYRAFKSEDTIRHILWFAQEMAPSLLHEIRHLKRNLRLQRGYTVGPWIVWLPLHLTELLEMFLDVAQHCHEIRNYSAACLILLTCARRSVLPFPPAIKVSGKRDMIKATVGEFYAAGKLTASVRIRMLSRIVIVQHYPE